MLLLWRNCWTASIRTTVIPYRCVRRRRDNPDPKVRQAVISPSVKWRTPNTKHAPSTFRSAAGCSPASATSALSPTTASSPGAYARCWNARISRWKMPAAGRCPPPARRRRWCAGLNAWSRIFPIPLCLTCSNRHLCAWRSVKPCGNSSRRLFVNATLPVDSSVIATGSRVTPANWRNASAPIAPTASAHYWMRSKMPLRHCTESGTAGARTSRRFARRYWKVWSALACCLPTTRMTPADNCSRSSTICVHR